MSEIPTEGKAAAQTPPPAPFSDRADWIGALAHAPGDRLDTLWNDSGLAPAFQTLRGPEIGLVMLRGRAGGVGDRFNLGEATATRCSVRLESGVEGHAAALGRDKRKAEIAALCDALMQTEARPTVIETILAPLSTERRDRLRDDAEKAAATRVEFFTLVRGED